MKLKSAITAVACVGALLAAAGCGSSDGGSDGTSGSTSGGDNANVAAAKQLVAAGLEGTMSRSDGGKVAWAGASTSPAPFPNGKVGILACPLAVEACDRISSAAKQAATELGWDAFIVDGRGDPSVQQAGVETMINRGVNCIVSLAAPARVFAPQIARAEKQGIKVFTGFADDPRQYGGQGGIGPDNVKAGEMIAAYVVANGGGKVLVFDAPQDPQLAQRTEGFKKYLNEHGGAEIVDTVDFDLTEIGPGEATKMKAALQRHPSGTIDWVLSPFDATLTPLLQAARELGRTEIKGISFDADQSSLEDLRNDPDSGQVATLSWSYEWVSWATIDECNRALQGAPINVNKDFPIRLIDKTNVPPPGGRDQPQFDYVSRFKQMWQSAEGSQ